MTSLVGADPIWEQIRSQHIHLYYVAQNRYHRKRTFEPGQIASCDGSIEVAFWFSLIGMGVKIDSSEMPVDIGKPKRFCIVNRHITGQTYEVFLLTTFGGAKNFEELGVLARNFGFPMGGTKWPNNVPGLTTIPPIFGTDKTSFVFAIPVMEVVKSSFLPPTTRLPPVELNRLRDFSKAKLRLLAERHKEIRTKLRIQRGLRRQNGSTSSDFEDKFKPAPRSVPMSLEDHDDVPDFFADSNAISLSRFKPPFLELPPRNDISWILRHAGKDYNMSKSFIQQSPVRPRRASLPKPYYAPLPITVKKILRSIR